MKSLKKLLLSRFIIIVLAHTFIVLLAVYGITFLNIRNSINWDLNRLEKRLIECIEQKEDRQQFKELVDSLNVGEEKQIKFAVYEGGELVFGDSLGRGLGDEELDINFHSYKEWSFEKISNKNGRTYISFVRASLDFIDDTMWILFLSLPLTLIPAVVLANRSFRTVVEPLREISTTLGKIEKGGLSNRVEGGAKNEEIDTLIKRMNDTLATLEESFSHSERFNANAAHELKTPLASLRGEIDVCLQNDRSQEEYEDCLVKCQDEIRHLDEVLKILLLISSPGHSMKDSFIDFDLRYSYEESKELLSLLAAAKNITLTDDLTSSVSKGSKELMRRAFFNLVENAIKYSPEGSEVKVVLNAKFFSVEDSAIVIKDFEKEEILKPFQRLESQESGAGLGLSLVKWIADLHAFELQIEPSQTGNKFTILFK